MTPPPSDPDGPCADPPGPTVLPGVSQASGVPAPLPAVVATSRDQQRRAAALREWKRSLPALLVALGLHAAALLVLDQFFHWLPDIDLSRVIVATVDDDAIVEPEPEPEEVPLELPPDLPEPIIEEQPEVDALVEDPDDIDASDEDILGLGASGLGGRGRRLRQGGLAGPTGIVAGLTGADRGFRGFVEDLRNRGLDVAFVVDATGSMRAFIDRARDTIDEIIVDLSSVVPSLRLAVVAYRDLDDDWTTKSTGLTEDRYLIHNFLIDLEAAGGKRGTPDFEEAVEVGLAVADGLDWRQGARRVIILVGDAPYHDQDQRAAMDIVRGFARGDHSLVNTIYVGSDGGDRPTDNQRRAADVMDRIARAGDGHAFRLVTDQDSQGDVLRRRITDATFGPQWAEEVSALLRRLPADSRRAQVQRKVERGDRRWLLGRLEKPPLHPAIPLGCIELFDRKVGEVCLALVLDEKQPELLRSAALYVLKRGLTTQIPFDVRQPVVDQTRAAARFEREIEQLLYARPAEQTRRVPGPARAKPLPEGG